MEEYSAYVGLDVHKDTIAVAVAYLGRSEPTSLGDIANTRKSVLRLVGRLSGHGEALGFCYEAGPCGYEVYRWIKEQDQDCVVVAPSKIPRKAGDRVKDGSTRCGEAGVAVSLWRVDVGMGTG